MVLSLEKFYINFAPVGIYVMMRYMKNCEGMSRAKKRNINKTKAQFSVYFERGFITQCS